MLFWVAPLSVPAQSVLSGHLLDADGHPIGGGQVLVKEQPSLAIRSDSTGAYCLPVPRGRWTVVAFALGYEREERLVESNRGDSLSWDIRLDPLSFEADAVALEAARTREFGLQRLGDVEDFGIFAARKTEVIPMAAVQANKATNNAREAFARVAGLNIWESDCGGLQLGLGGRGLSPGRSAHFNLRQDGVDIAAEAIGYPESYYSPPLQAVERVEIVRGAASLQYGPQFGGLVNFVLREGPTDRKAQVRSAQTLGSFGLFNSFNSLGGQLGPVNYYGYFQYKRGNCWRCNSSFEQQQGYLGLRVQLGRRASLRLSHTRMRYLAQQAGGLTDRLFAEDARQALRARNWFRVQWDLPSAQLDLRLARRWALNVRAFGLVAQRDALGRLDRINVADLGGPRDLIQDRFRNLGAEARLRHRFAWLGDTATILAGLRGYATHTVQRQGLGSEDSSATFAFLDLDGPE
ncbi:MAG: TonB-dependent receptor, partial [Bacteroidetes bacterium]